MEVQRPLRDFRELIEQEQFEEAERLLVCKLEEAKEQEDWNAQLQFLNQQIDFYRLRNKKELGEEAILNAIAVGKEKKEEKVLLYANTLVNAGKAIRDFGDAKRAVELYEEAYEIYKEQFHENDYRFAAFYNHMGVACEEVGRFEDAEQCFNKAIVIMERLPRGEVELALTHVNLACVYHQAGRNEKMEFHLHKAEQYFDSDNVMRGGYYAHACITCAEKLEKLGYQKEVEQLKERARRVYERD